MEQSVLETCAVDPERIAESSFGFGSLSRSLAEPPALPRPVRLDPLSPEITPNSLCSLTGQSHFQALNFHLMVLLCFLCRRKHLDVYLFSLEDVSKRPPRNQYVIMLLRKLHPVGFL